MKIWCNIQVSNIDQNKISEDNNKLFVAGEENLDIQILEEEDLPDIDETDMIHGLDHTGREHIHRQTTL